MRVKFKNLVKHLKLKTKRPRPREIVFALKKNLIFKKIELIIKESFYTVHHSEILEKSALLTYISILSIVPFLAVIFTFIHSFHGFNNLFTKTLNPLILRHFGTDVGPDISIYLQTIVSNLKLRDLGIISFVTFLITVMLLILKIEDIIDNIMGFSNNTGYIKRILKSWSIITIAPFIFSIILLKSDNFIKLINFSNYFFYFNYSTNTFRSLIGIFFEWIFFIFIYYVMPSKRVSFTSIAIGAFIACGLFECLQFINIFLVKKSLAYNPMYMYGSVPIIALLFFIWLRAIWVIILSGAAFTISSQKILFYNIKNEKQNIPIQGVIDCINIFKTILNQYQINNLPSSYTFIQKNTNIENQQLDAYLEYLIKKNVICITHQGTKNPNYFPTYRSIIEFKNDTYLKNILIDYNEIGKENYEEILKTLKIN